VVEQLRARAVGARCVGAQGGRKRRVVEVAILGFLKKAVAGQEAENSIERRLMSFAGSGEAFDWLRLAGLDEIGNAELGDRADRATEGGADQNAAELFGFLLSHDFKRELLPDAITPNTEPQEFNFRLAAHRGFECIDGAWRKLALSHTFARSYAN
jgi:hypothetical protein